jgi:hypothetical protein
VLSIFAFDRFCVVLGDIYFKDPNPAPGQESAERGVRLEVRFIATQPLDRSIYAARPILVGEPIWRLDLLESVDGKPGSFDRTHHHPLMHDWEPGKRKFERELSSDPLGYLAGQLRDLPAMLVRAEMSADAASDDDIRQMRESADEIVAATDAMLARVRKGELAHAAEPDESGLARTGWL